MYILNIASNTKLPHMWRWDTPQNFWRVWVNGPWFLIHNKVLNFHYWILYHELFHDKTKIQSMELSMDLWHLYDTKVITLIYSWLTLIRISIFLTNLKSPFNFIKNLLQFPFHNLKVCNLKMSIIQMDFQVLLGRFSL